MHHAQSMAAGVDGLEDELSTENVTTAVARQSPDVRSSAVRSLRTDTDGEGDDDGDDDEEEETEPRLKYTKLTTKLASVYRNGDSTSSFMVSENRMVDCETRPSQLKLTLILDHWHAQW